MPISNAEMIALLSGVLEPGRALRVREALSASPDLQARFMLLSAALREGAPAPRWVIPGPGAAHPRGYIASAEPVAVMGGAPGRPLRPGGTFLLRLPRLPDGDRRVVALLRQADGSWLPISPRTREQVKRLSELPQDGAEHVYVLQAGPEVGTQTWAVALPEEEAQDWADPTTWDELREAVACGEVPVASAEIVVTARRG